jgi:hypothetical protein
MKRFVIAGLIVKEIAAKDKYEAEEKFYRSIRPGKDGYYIGFDCVSIEESKL